MAAASGRDHGGGIDGARACFGGDRADWIDLSTGINPAPYPIPALPADCWTALPDRAAYDGLITAARAFWDVPKDAAIVAAPGASALIAQIPFLRPAASVHIPAPTYNEHAASFRMAGWTVTENDQQPTTVVVHPNNPTGQFWDAPTGELVVIDESFCDIDPERSLMAEATKPGRIILKSFGKFWGLAGVRLGFAMGDPDLIQSLSDRIGPWAVPGPALAIGAAALSDLEWATSTRQSLAQGAQRLDGLLESGGAKTIGGTSLFRLYEVDNAEQWQARLAHHHIWSRIFPYSKTWLRLGLPPTTGWDRLTTALGTAGGATRPGGSVHPSAQTP